MTADRRFDAAARRRETGRLLRDSALAAGAALTVAYWSGAVDGLGARSGSVHGGYDGSRVQEDSTGLTVFALAAGDNVVVRYAVRAKHGALRVALHEYTLGLGDGSPPLYHSLRGEVTGELTMPASRWGIFAIDLRPVCPETPECSVHYDVEWSRR